MSDLLNNTGINLDEMNDKQVFITVNNYHPAASSYYQTTASVVKYTVGALLVAATAYYGYKTVKNIEGLLKVFSDFLNAVGQNIIGPSAMDDLLDSGNLNINAITGDMPTGTDLTVFLSLEPSSVTEDMVGNFSDAKEVITNVSNALCNLDVADIAQNISSIASEVPNLGQGMLDLFDYEEDDPSLVGTLIGGVLDLFWV